MPAIATHAVSHAPPEPLVEYPKTVPPDTRAVLDALTDIVCITSVDGTLRFLNRAGRDLLGYADDDAALTRCLVPTHTPAARALLLDEVIPTALRRGSASGDTALQTADGRVFPAAQTVVVTIGAGGQPVSLTIVIRNVSVERQATARLGESQRLFEMIARCAPDLMYLYDPTDERIVWTNRCPHAFLGGDERDARSLDRREMLRLVHPDDRAQLRAAGTHMAGAYSDSDVLTNEIRVRSAGNSWRWIHTRTSVFSRRETGAPLLLLGTATDVSARKKAEQQLVENRDTAERASQLSNDFLACISAEFRGALHGIIGTATDVHADRERRLTARELELLQDMIADSTQLLATVADLHDFTRVESGAMPVCQVLADVRHVIRESIAAFDDHPACVRAPIVAQLPHTAAPILTDPARLRQVLSQLLAHSLVSAPDSRVTVSLRVDSATTQPISIDVFDSRAVYEHTPDDRQFAPFAARSGHASSSIRATRGADLGLSLARSMCEMLGCALSVSPSGVGAGSAFRITLPAPSRAALLAADFKAPVAAANARNADPGSIVIPSV